MCGIYGAIALTENGRDCLVNIKLANELLKARGPDKQEVFVDDDVALGHCRLSIIDTSENASQPMSDDTGRYVIIYNGEFYNYREHRKRLLDNGIRLNSRSDTEVLLNMYILEGQSFLEKVNGFFAFAIYDRHEKTVFMARDRMGIKPLIYYYDNDHFLFASEMKSLLANDIVPREIDPVSLYTYMQLNYLPAPYTMLKGVRRLIPGECVKVDLTDSMHKVRIRKYYSLPYIREEIVTPGNFSYDDARKKLVDQG